MSSNFLEIENATFAASKKNKVNNVSLTIKKEGEILCLLGPSGIGKTTMLRTIAGLQNLQSGKIKLKGRVISSEDYNLEPEKRNIALCFQDNSLFPHYNVLDNINIGSKRNKNSKNNLQKTKKRGLDGQTARISRNPGKIFREETLRLNSWIKYLRFLF